MAIYHFQSGSLLDEIRIVTNETGGTRAYVHARTDVSQHDLVLAQASLHQQGWKTVPVLFDGKPMLEVRGFKQPVKLLQWANTGKWVNGEVAVTPLDGDVRTNKEKWQNATLQAAGGVYLVGDASYIFYSLGPLIENWGKLSKTERGFDILDVVAGVGYMAGSAVLTKYGSRDQSQNTIQSAMQKICRYARKEGHELPDDLAATQILKEPERSAWGKLSHTFAKYPSETLNSIYVFVGSCLSAVAFYRGTRTVDPGLPADAYTKAVAKRNSFRSDVGLGLVTAASALAGLTIKEQKPIEGEPKRKGLGRIIDWIQEKPLRATGYGFMIATGFHALGTYQQWDNKAQKKPYLIGRAIFIVANIVSEFLLTLSSKGHGTGVKPDSSVDESVIAATAGLILRQPVASREAMIDQLAGYIASPEVLGGKADDIATALRKQIAGLEKNPWIRSAIVEQVAAPGAVAANDPALPTAKVSGIRRQEAMQSAMPKVALG